MRKTDVIASLIIGEAAALLAVAVSRGLPLPRGLAAGLWLLPVVFPLFTLAVMAAGSIAGRRLPVAYQFSKFLLVGGLNFLIDLGVLNLLIALTAITGGFYAVVFKALSFLAAVTSSFLWNKFWTFRSLSVEAVGLQFVGFLTVAGLGLGLNAGIFYAVNDLVGPQGAIPPRTWANIAAFVAASLGLAWNFIGYKYLVFKKRS